MRNFFGIPSRVRAHPAPRRPLSWRPTLEVLEDRSLLSSTFIQTNLVSDLPGMASNTDPKLVNPWGVAFSASGPFWVADNGTDVSTLYNSAGTPQPLVVAIPAPTAGGKALPTGMVFNGTQSFKVSNGTTSAPAAFLFATISGTISGWNPTVDSTHAIIAVNNSGHAVYTGLALTTPPGGNPVLLAANFAAGTIDAFDQNFHPTTLPGGFVDQAITPGFAPFNVQALNGKIYVAFAAQNRSPNGGFVDVFDTNGTLLNHIASPTGLINAPWGMTIAPAQFGDFSNAFLVGNFGDGHITAFNPITGASLGQLKDASGTLVTNDHLWALTFGNGGQAGSKNTLFFTAGIQNETHGLLGSLTEQDTVVPPLPPSGPKLFAVGTDAGVPAEVKVFNAETKAVVFDLMPYGQNFQGGVRVAVGDVTGDGEPDIVTVPGTGGSPLIHVFDGSTGRLVTGPLASFFAYDQAFSGGVFVALGDVNHDGTLDIVTGADAGGGPHVKAFSGKDASTLESFFAYAPSFTGGVRVSAADFNGDGFADILTGAGVGGGPHVKVVNSKDNSVLRSFFAYDPSFTGGIYVSVADVNQDRAPDVITGAGAGGGPHVKGFSGLDNTLLRSLLAYEPQFSGGVRVGAVELNGNGHNDIVTGPGPGGGPRVLGFDGQSLTDLDDLFAFDSSFRAGIFVAGG